MTAGLKEVGKIGEVRVYVGVEETGHGKMGFLVEIAHVYSWISNAPVNALVTRLPEILRGTLFNDNSMSTNRNRIARIFPKRKLHKYF